MGLPWGFAVQYNIQHSVCDERSTVLSAHGRSKEKGENSLETAKGGPFRKRRLPLYQAPFQGKKRRGSVIFQRWWKGTINQGGPLRLERGLGAGENVFFAAPSCKEDIWQRKKRKTYPGKRLGVTSERTPYPPFPRGSLFDMQHHIIRRHPPFLPT